MIRLDSTEAELDALQRVCERLAGFHDRVTLEWLDGALCAVMAGPSVPPGPEAVLEPLLGDAWTRTFADPEDAAQAIAALRARWRVLRSQLDPDALIDDWGALRLSPLLLAPADDVALGADWAAGFLHVVEEPAWGWPDAATDEDHERALADLRALRDAGGAAGDTDAAREEASEALVDTAAFAAQDLRLWWIDHMPRTAPRRAEATPGRNDPCPCGSGKKFKKCHGLA